jgi:predicted GNAT family N-acyltransferase
LSLSVVFEALQPHHDRQRFDCGTPALNEFLHNQARQNADRNLGVSHLAVERAGGSKILAYYTLVTRTVDREIIPTKKLPSGDIGVVLLGRLAVDNGAKSQGLGRLCVTRAMLQVARAARQIGIYALVLDAIDERARNWYLSLNLGFQTLLDDPNHLFVPIETIRTAVEAPSRPGEA